MSGSKNVSSEIRENHFKLSSKHAYYTKSQTFSHLHVFSLNLNKKWCLETWENSLLALRIDLPTYIIDGEKNSSCCSQNLSVVKNILEAYDPEKMPSFLLIWPFFNPKLLIYMVVIKVLRGLLSLSYIIGRTDPCNYLQEVVHTTSTQTNSVESTTSKYNSSLLCVPKRSASTIIAVEVVRPLYSLFFVMLVRLKNSITVLYS